MELDRDQKRSWASLEECEQQLQCSQNIINVDEPQKVLDQ